MNIHITKGARQYGYVIWNSKIDSEVESMLSGLSVVSVKFNGFNLGEKNIDRKYHRISLGYKLTRALPTEHDTFSVAYIDGVLEVKSFDGRK